MSKNRSLPYLPVVTHFTKKLDHDIQVYGPQKAMHNALMRSGTKLTIIGQTKKIANILKTKPVVIIANHPFEAETFALRAALPHRFDQYMIVTSSMLGLGENIDKYLIPVYIRHHNQPKNKRPSILGKFMDWFHPVPIYSPQIEHEKNIESINHASKIITQGGSIIIFPGRRSETGHWFPGIGHMIKNIGRTEAYVINARVAGTSDLDYLRLLPGVGKFLPTITVTFSGAIKIQEINSGQPKDITQRLEELYTNWEKRIK